MSDQGSHLHQARHNEKLASELLTSLGYKDWLITISFYSALHFLEAKLATMTPPKHSDTDVPVDIHGKLKCSPHTWREKLVQKHFSAIWNNYRKLRNDSKIARYLATSHGSHISVSGHDYFDDTYAADRFNIDLREIKTKLGY